MARVRINSALSSAHGKVGDIVIKRYKYGEVISRVPRMGAVPASEKQLARHDKWRRAGEYYQRVKADPALAACYERARKKTGFPLPALTARDFNRPPIVDTIELKGYQGRAGEVIEVHARDDTCVTGVAVTLRNAAGEVLETGKAVTDYDYLWRYVTQTNVPRYHVVTIEAEAWDLPGNRTSRAVTWSQLIRSGTAGAVTALPSPAPNAGRTPAAVVRFEPPNADCLGGL